MTKYRAAPLALYLLLCLLVGGSSLNVWGNFLLQLLGIGLLAWVAISCRDASMSKTAKALMILLALTILLLMVQLVPLPPSVWTALPGRSFLQEGQGLLGNELGWAPLSLAPYETLAAGFTLLVPAAVFVTIVCRPTPSPRLLVSTFLVAAFAGCLLGVLQVAGGQEWYLYRLSSFGAATGFFANSNHMGSLLLASAPFLVALSIDGIDASTKGQSRAVITVSALAAMALLVVAIILNGSFAAQLLGIPVVLACMALVAVVRAGRQRRLLAFAGLSILVVCVGLGSVYRSRLTTLNAESLSTRSEIWATSARALEAVGAAGAGIGSFPAFYPQFEDPARVTSFYVNHAHNDYLELLIEAGLAGLLLIAIFLASWVTIAVRCWRDPEADVYSRAATVASATVLLHSLVDYPLRTPALAAVFAMCLGLMAVRHRRPSDLDRNAMRPSRHRRMR